MIHRILKTHKKELFFELIILGVVWLLGVLLDVGIYFDMRRQLNAELGGVGITMVCGALLIVCVVGFVYFASGFSMAVGFGQTRKKFLLDEIVFVLVETLIGAALLAVFYGVNSLIFSVLLKFPYLTGTSFLMMEGIVLTVGILGGTWVRVFMGAVLLRFKNYVSFFFPGLVLVEMVLFRVFEGVFVGLWLIPIIGGLWIAGITAGVLSLMRQSV